MKIKKSFFIFVFFSFLSAAWTQTSEYTLESLLSATAQNHPELLKLQEEYQRSLLDVKDAWAGLGPTVDLQVSGTYMTNSPLDTVYINVDEIINSIQWDGVKPAASGQYIKAFDGMEDTLYNFQLSVTQPIFTWGKITNAIKLYQEISEIKKTQLSQQTEQLETELKTRVISLFYLNKILTILDEEQAYADRMVEVSENAEKSGMLLHQEVVDAKIQAKELEIAKQDLLEQMNNQLLELVRTSGLKNLSIQNINYDFVPELLKSFDELMTKNHEELEEEILSGNQLSIKLLTQLQEVSKIAEKISRGYENWKPDLALQMSGGYSGSRFPLIEPNWMRKDDYSLNISIGLKTTVWDGGKKVRDVSRKKSEVKTADINKLDARSSISKTFNSQWNAAQVCTMKIEYQDLKIESAASKISQKQQMYESGYGSETDVLSAKIEACNAQIEKEKQALSRAAACLTIDYLRK
ncbi:MAG: TolC family protein [Treponema sp.]|nr:TolC family protein [Treponema sp.]